MIWYDSLLDDGNFTPNIKVILKNKITELRELVKIQDDIIEIDKVPEVKVAYVLVAKIMPDLIKMIEDKLNESSINYKNLNGNVNIQLLNKLENFIPPDVYIGKEGNEVVSTFESVVNVGWILWLLKYSELQIDKDQASTEEYLEEINAINRLILKAIEYIDLRNHYNTN